MPENVTKRVPQYVTICAAQEVGQLGEVWELLHLSLTRSLARAREERRAQAQLEVIGGNVFSLWEASNKNGKFCHTLMSKIPHSLTI